MKDVKNQAMASESHDPASLVSVVSLKCVLHVAVNLPIAVGQCSEPGWNSRLKSLVYFEHHGQIILKPCCTCTTDAVNEGSPRLMISSS